jgi:hypothetical protein
VDTKKKITSNNSLIMCKQKKKLTAKKIKPFWRIYMIFTFYLNNTEWYIMVSILYFNYILDITFFIA